MVVVVALVVLAAASSVCPCFGFGLRGSWDLLGTRLGNEDALSLAKDCSLRSIGLRLTPNNLPVRTHQTVSQCPGTAFRDAGSLGEEA